MSCAGAHIVHGVSISSYSYSSTSLGGGGDLFLKQANKKSGTKLHLIVRNKK